MDTLQARLAELADDAPTGGSTPAELWARGKRAHRLRMATIAATVLVVGAVGTGVAIGLTDDDKGPDIAPAGTVDISLPIEYPVGEELPNLGDTPGWLAAVWLDTGEDSTLDDDTGRPRVVALVAETGTFGTLPIDVWSEMYLEDPDAYFALSPDGRRIAYHTPARELAVRDLVSGERYSPAFDGFKPRPESEYTWVDATHLVGHVAPAGAGSEHQGSDADGWVWEPGTAPKLVDLNTYPGSVYLWANAGKDPWFLTDQADPRKCLSLRDLGAGKTMPLLCDVVGRIGSELALTHDGTGAVVALDVHGVENPALRQVVATAGAPQRVTFATDLIGKALAVDGGAS
jgi:hypothetical protein